MFIYKSLSYFWQSLTYALERCWVCFGGAGHGRFSRNKLCELDALNFLERASGWKFVIFVLVRSKPFDSFFPGGTLTLFGIVYHEFWRAGAY